MSDINFNIDLDLSAINLQEGFSVEKTLGVTEEEYTKVNKAVADYVLEVGSKAVEALHALPEADLKDKTFKMVLPLYGGDEVVSTFHFNNEGTSKAVQLSYTYQALDQVPKQLSSFIDKLTESSVEEAA